MLQGRLHVVCGSEEFESDRGPWTVLGAPSLRQPHYVADFTAKVMEPSRLLQISRSNYEAALKREAETLAAAVRAAAAEQAAACARQPIDSGAGVLISAGPRSPVARVACTLAPELASAYTELSALPVAILGGSPGLNASWEG